MKNDFSTWLIVLRTRVVFDLLACSINYGYATVQYPWGQGYTGMHKPQSNRRSGREGAVKGPASCI